MPEEITQVSQFPDSAQSERKDGRPPRRAKLVLCAPFIAFPYSVSRSFTSGSRIILLLAFN